MDFKQLILDRIKRNRISTTEIADCMNKTGDIPEVYPITSGHFAVGEVFWTYAYNESNWEHHEQLENAPEGCILLTETFNCKHRAIFGELVAKYLMLYRQVAGVVVMGKLRDVPHLIKEKWPIWYSGPTPIGCFNKKNEELMDADLIEQRKEHYNGSIAICDDSGVVIIPKHLHNQVFLDKLNWIEEQEDIWFDCLDRRKWSTYRTVCLKDYLKTE